VQDWKIKVNGSKSSHLKFTLRKGHCPAVNITHTTIPQTETVKYPGLHFDRQKKKTDLKTKEINSLIEKNNPIYL